MAKTQDKNFKIAVMNIKDFKENMNKPIGEIYENTNSRIK